MKQHSYPKKPLTPEMRRIEPTNRPRQTSFMGMLTAASKPAAVPVSPVAPRFELTETQSHVIHACSTGKNVFYTGGAGTGKSTLLTRLIELLVQQHGRKHVFVAATTGLAACAVGGTTVHQFAGISSALDESSDASVLKIQFERVVNQVYCTV
jgi:ATPase subunit of ABC transporter with duplicated ATPase domains